MIYENVVLTVVKHTKVSVQAITSHELEFPKVDT
jgi:hypothetical protein